jgi:hypothetical protein
MTTATEPLQHRHRGRRRPPMTLRRLLRLLRLLGPLPMPASLTAGPTCVWRLPLADHALGVAPGAPLATMERL